MIHCFYHSADLDGHCSGALVAIYHKYNKEEVTLHPINYDDPFPWEAIQADDTVYMVDFGLQPIAEMFKLNGMCELIWIDHHITAIDEYKRHWKEHMERQIKGLREVGKAGCELTFEWLYPDAHLPTVVHLLGRYDVWEWKDVPNALEFQYGMRQYENTHPSNIELWEELIVEEDGYLIKEIINRGKTLLEYEDNQNAKLCKYLAFETEFDGNPIIAINKGMSNSKVFDSVWDESKHDFMLTFVRVYGKYNISLYTTRDDINVGEIAKQYGGGGHQKAAGFSCKELPFEH